jgi:hypothetical protein
VPLSLIVSSINENSPAIISYFGKTMLPVNLTVLPNVQDTSLLFGIVAGLICILVALKSGLKRFTIFLFGLIWFLSFLVPSLVISFIKHEYRLYLPLIGIIIMILETDAFSKILQHKKYSRWIFGCLLLVFTVGTIVYSGQFKDKNTFWNKAVTDSPHSPLAHRNWGAMLFLQENYKDAEVFFKKALELNPQEQMAHNNLGLIYSKWDMPELAEREYLQELKINPGYADCHFNLGLLYYRQKKYQQTIQSWQKAIIYNPNHYEAHKNLVILNYQIGQVDLAKHYIEIMKKKGMPIPAEFKRMKL